MTEKKKIAQQRSPDNELDFARGWGFGVGPDTWGHRKRRWWARCPLCERILASWSSSMAFGSYVKHVIKCAEESSAVGAGIADDPRDGTVARAGSKASMEQQILAVIRRDGAQTRRALAAKTGRHPVSVHKVIKKLVDSGQLYAWLDDGREQMLRYGVSPPPAAAAAVVVSAAAHPSAPAPAPAPVDDVRGLILDLLDEMGELTWFEICQEVGPVAEKAAAAAIEDMVAGGIIVGRRTGRGLALALPK